MKQPKINKKYFFVERLHEMMEKDKVYLRPQLSVFHVCAVLGTNRTYLSEYLNQVRKQTFYEYLSDYRVAYAQKLLASESRIPIEEVSTISGFSSISTFRRAFVKRVGTTPLKYRHIKLCRRER